MAELDVVAPHSQRHDDEEREGDRRGDPEERSPVGNGKHRRRRAGGTGRWVEIIGHDRSPDTERPSTIQKATLFPITSAPEQRAVTGAGDVRVHVEDAVNLLLS